MKLLLCSVFLTLFLLIAKADVLIESSDDAPERTGHCYSKREGIGNMNEGEVKQHPHKCMSVTCLDNGFIEYVGCGAVNVPGGCELIEDKSKPHPDCCATVKC